MKYFFREIKAIASATIDVAVEARAVAQVILDLKHFARACEVNAQMHPVALGAIAALLRRGLLSSFDTYLERTITCAREIAKHYEVNVTSAVTLRAPERASLSTALAKRLDGTIALEESTDASILGGLILETNGWRFDASVKGRIHRLEYRMKNARV